jgi:hypothetical protein
MAGKLCELLQLCAQLAAAVAAVLEEPSCEHSKDVQDLVSRWLEPGLVTNSSVFYFLVSSSRIGSSSLGRGSCISVCWSGIECIGI